jgi:hypothetical protein
MGPLQCLYAVFVFMQSCNISGKRVFFAFSGPIHAPTPLSSVLFPQHTECGVLIDTMRVHMVCPICTGTGNYVQGLDGLGARKLCSMGELGSCKGGY